VTTVSHDAPQAPTLHPAAELAMPITIVNPDIPRFTVLCRIDAYADYIAEVEADSAEEAAEIARDCHQDYLWRHQGTTEFDDRLYITLDANGDEIEDRRISDF
jgi:hypothetical protein